MSFSFVASIGVMSLGIAPSKRRTVCGCFVLCIEASFVVEGETTVGQCCLTFLVWFDERSREERNLEDRPKWPGRP